MKTVDEALALIAQHTPGTKVIAMPVNESIVGHVLAEDVVAVRDDALDALGLG